MTVRLVLARTYGQAATYATMNRLTPEEWRYVTSPQVLRGFARGSRVWCLEGWHKRADFLDLANMLRERQAVLVR